MPQALEVKMTTVKGLAVIALLVGGTSLAMAQNGPPGPGVVPGAPQSTLQSAPAPTGAASGTRIAHRQTTKHHKKMYMSAKGSHHNATLKENSRLQAAPSSKQ
jgi:hypothetical protein